VQRNHGCTLDDPAALRASSRQKSDFDRGERSEMRRLNFLDDEPWDEVNDDLRRRWFGHPFGADMLALR
jgi:hypothetical protein